jgi:hypothetical protein
MVGPGGFGQQNYVFDGNLYTYQILFENQTNATAPAQSVTITDPLSTNLVWSRFALTEISFGDTAITLPPGSQFFQTNIPVSFEGVNFAVQIQAGINLANGQVFANFASIDPVTSLPPPVNIGFLPPEDGTGRGMGQISYTVQPQPNLATGTQIPNVAYIRFDINPVIATDQVNDNNASLGIATDKEAIVTIDSTPPTSSVGALGSPQTSTNFVVSWSGSDVGSGLASFDIYVSEDGGPWFLWLANTTNTSAVYSGAFGHSYGFYSIAEDNVGNLQAAPSAGEASTIVLIAPSITWTNPADIVFGTALSATQLNAVSTVAGVYAYNPPIGTVLNAGPNQTLRVTFTPGNTNVYTMATAMVSLSVDKANQTITFGTIGNLAAGDSVSLTATASSGLGASLALVSGPAILSGNVLTATNAGTAVIQATQAGNTNYNAAPVVTQSINVLPPSLQITLLSDEVTISWPAAAPGFVLQSSANLLAPALWIDVTNALATNESTISTTIKANSPANFYRLVFPGDRP